ncbi:MAG TPA: DUF883 family protein [Steroidobacteraceae bacterium]|jgi:ElaB/YqjD/DUF883 family membrane-anchored ribosome-binding protein|nr:DUF883 family protein [Steroidobacteraceae bacterium]
MEDLEEAGMRGLRAARNGGERSSEWQNLVADVEDLVKRVADVDDEEIARIRSRVQDTLQRAKSTATSRIAHARDRAEEVTDATDEYVRENPWAAIGIAAAIGIVIGFVAGRR